MDLVIGERFPIFIFTGGNNSVAISEKGSGKELLINIGKISFQSFCAWDFF
jgi:hypothetical protein